MTKPAIGTKAYNAELARLLESEYRLFMRRADEVRWSPKQVPYEKIEFSKLTVGDLFAVFVTLHIENYSDVYTRLLLDHFNDAPLLGEFIKNWEREEENHARVLEGYLVALGFPPGELKTSYARVDKADFPFPSRDQTGLNVFVFFQELLTREMYTKLLKSCKEPVLVDILKRVVRDEERHYRFYRQALELRLRLDRRDTLRQFRRIVRTFGMPQTMYRQTAMTDRLMQYYRYTPAEIRSIASPVVKVLEAGPSRWLALAPRLQRLWQQRRAALYLTQSPYLWGHLATSLKNAVGLGAASRQDQRYVQSIVDRLHALLKEKQGSGEKIAVHDRLAAF